MRLLTFPYVIIVRLFEYTEIVEVKSQESP